MLAVRYLENTGYAGPLGDASDFPSGLGKNRHGGSL